MFSILEKPTVLESGFPRGFCIILSYLQKHQTMSDLLESEISWYNYEETLLFFKDLFIYSKESAQEGRVGGGEKILSRLHTGHGA